MKKLLIILLAGLFTCSLNAQKAEPYTFKEFKKISATPVKSQDQTGTCWAFSTASFLESEAQRLGKGEQNISEMFVVRYTYRQKCENYVRRQGNAGFSEGGLAHDLLNAVKQYGIAPESAYPGRKDPTKPYNHRQLEKTLKTLCDELVKQGQNGQLQEKWLSRVDSVLDQEFGPVPAKFKMNNLTMDPIGYRNFLGIVPDDYVNITSFTHHPFYSQFVLEVPDNFSNGQFYNLPLNELMQCLNYSIQQGYSVEWDADKSNLGFSAQNGIAIVPDKDWKDKNKEEQAGTFKTWEPEKNVTQEYRQQLFDRQITQDDHLMHITGILDEAHSGVYYIVKNSWGEISDNKGYLNVSEAYMRQNTISFTVHKDALPTNTRKRLGLEEGDVNIPKGSTGATTEPNDNQKGFDKNNPQVVPGKPRMGPKAKPGNKENGELVAPKQ